MDGIEGWVPALGPSGWQGGEVFSEVQRWNRIEADGQMKTPWLPPLHNVILFVKLLPSTRQVLPKRRGAPAFGLGLLHFVDAR